MKPREVLAEWNRDDLSAEWDGESVTLSGADKRIGMDLSADDALWLLEFLETHELDLLKMAKQDWSQRT